MTKLQCSCGYAGGDADELGDHLREAFTPADDIGVDGRVHGEVAADHRDVAEPRRLACFCGFTGNGSELDAHVLAVFITPDRVGVDGTTHLPE
jgi:hypothetical protein